MRAPKFLLSVVLLAVLACGTTGQDAHEKLPEVVQHADPKYPPLAKQTSIAGDVVVSFTTDGESIREVKVESGHPLLRQATEDNVKTWRFVPHAPARFQVTYRYKLQRADTDIEFLREPGVVSLTQTPPTIYIVYASIGRGTWKAKIAGAAGPTSQVFQFFSTGPDEQELDGNTGLKYGEGDEIDFGHRDGSMLAFNIKLTQADKKTHVNTFFLAKIIGNRIVGTWMDEHGTRGQWSAVRIPDPPHS